MVRFSRSPTTLTMPSCSRARTVSANSFGSTGMEDCSSMDRIADCHLSPCRPLASSNVRICERRQSASLGGCLPQKRGTDLSLEISTQLPLLLTGTSGNEIQIDLTCDGIRLEECQLDKVVNIRTAMNTYCTLPNGISDQSECLLDIFQVYSL